MTCRTTKIVLLAAMFALGTSGAAFGQLPCGVANQIACQPWDGGSNLFGSQNDTNDLGNFATVYQQFTLAKGYSYYDVESFHWVGGYFNPANPGPITAWTLTPYSDAGGTPGGAIAAGPFPGTGGETLIGNVNGFPIYVYWLYFQSFDMAPGSYGLRLFPTLASRRSGAGPPARAPIPDTNAAVADYRA